MAAEHLSSGLLRDEHAELLDVTDRLWSLGLGHHMPLPQLVVCGDQSSGKSSVLESISGVKFPVSDGICTRFAIQLVLRRSLQTARSVSIESGKSSSDDQKKRFEEFNKAKGYSEDLSKIIEQAKTEMGLIEGSTFSDARLRIEISGPEQPHLTLVDLPGLIHTPDSSQTDSDVETVKKLVDEYMRQERTIILAVVSANNQAGLQEVLKMAKLRDPAGNRTMGIITKPDTLPSGSEMERKYLKYARNQEAPFGLGWHVVRNANYQECKDKTYDRHNTEHDLFSREPWKGLPRSSLGADALVKRLSKCSFELTRAELPNVVREIKSNIAEYQKRLQQLGSPRTSVDERRVYLTGVAIVFLQVVRDGVRGQYECEDYFAVPSRRLRAEYCRLTDEFADSIRREGRGYEPQPNEYQGYLEVIDKEVLKPNRGLELPTDFNPLLVRTIFKKQSHKWEGLALQYADEVFLTAKRFVVGLLECTTEATIFGKLLEEFIEPAMSLKQGRLHDKVEELLTPYTKSYPYSKRPEFARELAEIALAYKQSSPSGSPEHAAAMYACKKLAEQEKAYYNTALETFIDNMATLAVENCVLADLHTMFSPLTVSKMDEQTVNRLASESTETIDAREYISHNLQIFEEALRICRKCGCLTPAVAGGGILNQPAAGSHLVSTAPQNLGLGDLADRLSLASLAPPKIELNDGAQAKEDPRAGSGLTTPVASNTSARSRTQSSTRSPLPAHSPGASLSSARSASSMSSPASSPTPRNGRSRVAQAEAENEIEL